MKMHTVFINRSEDVFQRNHVVSAGKNDLWLADLIDMVKFAKLNDSSKYILLVIDTFSKYVWLRPLKYRTGEEVARAFKDIFNESKRLPAKFITDKGIYNFVNNLSISGQAFRARKVQSLMKENSVRYFQPERNQGANIREGFINYQNEIIPVRLAQ